MRTILCSCFVVFLIGEVFGDDIDPPIGDKRLAVHTLLREDIFAGWLAKDMESFARGEKNIDLLLEQRPASKADLLSWKGGAKLYRAVLAHEAGNKQEFQELYKEAVDILDEAKALAPKSPAVASIVGGSYLTFADRLPEELRAEAWQKAYDNYQLLWKLQGKIVERLPLHMQGELLAGVVQSAQRTGHEAEFNEYLDKVIAIMPDTPYAKTAEQWKKDPQVAATANISCQSCHAPGRLEARLAVKKETSDAAAPCDLR